MKRKSTYKLAQIYVILGRVTKVYLGLFLSICRNILVFFVWGGIFQRLTSCKDAGYLGSFINYVFKFLGIFDHCPPLPPPLVITFTE